MWFVHGLYEAAAMFWEVLWALVFGFVISAAMQVFVSQEQMTRVLGRAGMREVALATGMGAASSSCSYAAAAAAKTAFKKGAALVPALAFMFASTNLVFELGIVLWLLMGWRFVLAEFVGAFVLIAFMWLLVRLTLPKGLVQNARDNDESQGVKDCHNHGGDHGGEHSHQSSSIQSSRLQAVANAFAMDVSMMWKEVVIGFGIAGFIAVLVPMSVWRAVFLPGHVAPAAKLIENALVGPLIAVASFVCSVGNIPLASILWSGGISFGGVLSFIYADLIVLPLILIYARYYGWRAALYITSVMYISMVMSGIVVDLAFSALHLIPTGPRPQSPIMNAHFAWNYTTWLDIPAILIATLLAIVHHRGTRAIQMAHHEQMDTM